MSWMSCQDTVQVKGISRQIQFVRQAYGTLLHKAMTILGRWRDSDNRNVFIDENTKPSAVSIGQFKVAAFYCRSNVLRSVYWEGED